MGYWHRRRPRDRVLIVDADPAVLPRSVLDRPDVEFLTCRVPREVMFSSEARFEHAHALLTRHARDAKVVITSHIHAALPSLAQGAPVIFVHGPDLPGGQGRREVGIADLFHRFDPSRQNWTHDLDDMPPNPGINRADRYRASFWRYVKTRASPLYADAARLFGLVPLQRLGEGIEPELGTEPELEPAHDLFHFLLLDLDPDPDPGPDPDRREEERAAAAARAVRRAAECALRHHPNARVYVHSDYAPSRGGAAAAAALGEEFDVFREAGYIWVVGRRR